MIFTRWGTLKWFFSKWKKVQWPYEGSTAWRPRRWWAVKGTERFSNVYCLKTAAILIPTIQHTFLNLLDEIPGKKLLVEFDDSLRCYLYTESDELEMHFKLRSQEHLYQATVLFSDHR